MESGIVYIMGQLVGMLLAAGVTMAAIYLVRGPLERFLAALIDDPVVARLGSSFVLLLFGLRGLVAILNYITQPELQEVLGELIRLLERLAADVQWVAQVAALFFIGYAISRWGRDVRRVEGMTTGSEGLEEEDE